MIEQRNKLLQKSILNESNINSQIITNDVNNNSSAEKISKKKFESAPHIELSPH